MFSHVSLFLFYLYLYIYFKAQNSQWRSHLRFTAAEAEVKLLTEHESQEEIAACHCYVF